MGLYNGDVLWVVVVVDKEGFGFGFVDLLCYGYCFGVGGGFI